MTSYLNEGHNVVQKGKAMAAVKNDCLNESRNTEENVAASHAMVKNIAGAIGKNRRGRGRVVRYIKISGLCTKVVLENLYVAGAGRRRDVRNITGLIDLRRQKRLVSQAAYGNISMNVVFYAVRVAHFC